MVLEYDFNDWGPQLVALIFCDKRDLQINLSNFFSQIHHCSFDLLTVTIQGQILF